MPPMSSNTKLEDPHTQYDITVDSLEAGGHRLLRCILRLRNFDRKDVEKYEGLVCPSTHWERYSPLQSNQHSELTIPDPTPKFLEDGEHRYVVLVIKQSSANDSPDFKVEVQLPVPLDIGDFEVYKMPEYEQIINGKKYSVKVKMVVDDCAAVCKYQYGKSAVDKRSIGIGTPQK